MLKSREERGKFQAERTLADLQRHSQDVSKRAPEAEYGIDVEASWRFSVQTHATDFQHEGVREEIDFS